MPRLSPLKRESTIRPYPLQLTINVDSTAQANTPITLINKSNTGHIREKTNSAGKTIFELSNFALGNEQVTTPYANNDVAIVVVGGNQGKVHMRYKGDN